jgi:hypothetical protein
MPAGFARLPQVLQAQQHGEHPFELAVEMDLIADRSCLSGSSDSPNACSWIRALFASLEPRQHLAFQEPPQAGAVVPQFVRVAGQRVLSV